MPCVVKLKVWQARDLPVMDRKSKLTDAFVTVRFGGDGAGLKAHKVETRICRRSLNPVWNEDFRIDVPDEATLQDGCVEFKVWDKVRQAQGGRERGRGASLQPLTASRCLLLQDTYTSDDSIGSVFIDLNPLLAATDYQQQQYAAASALLPPAAVSGLEPSSAAAGAAAFFSASSSSPAAAGSSSPSGPASSSSPPFVPPSTLSGWYPLYDTINGIRGSLRLSLKLHVFSEHSAQRAGVSGGGSSGLPVPQLNSSALSPHLRLASVHGLVEQLIVSADPEYHWVDSFRASRTSNEQRQLLFNRLVMAVRRGLSRKARELGGNCLLGCSVVLDLEGEVGVVARGLGTAVTVRRRGAGGEGGEAEGDGVWRGAAGAERRAESERSADPGQEEAAAGGDSGAADGGVAGSGSGGGVSGSGSEAASALSLSRSYRRDLHLLTLTSFPASLSLVIGGLVLSRSVKLLESSATTRRRERWWKELRQEVRSHAAALHCTHVLGYREETSVCGDVAVLTAYGTACRGGWAAAHRDTERSLPAFSAFKVSRRAQPDCGFCHVPFSRSNSPMRISLTPCNSCGRRWVPEVLLSSLQLWNRTDRSRDRDRERGDDEPLAQQQQPALQTAASASFSSSASSSSSPPSYDEEAQAAELALSVPLLGRGQLVESRICRSRRRAAGEANAQLLSDLLPFMEYELHRQLMHKLRVCGLNAVFSLSSRISLGEEEVVGIMSGTAVYLPMLPPPPPLRIARWREAGRELLGLEKRLQAVSEERRRQWARRMKKWKRGLREERRRRRREERERERERDRAQQSGSSLLASPLHPATGSGTRRRKGKKRRPQPAPSAFSLSAEAAQDERKEEKPQQQQRQEERERDGREAKETGKEGNESSSSSSSSSSSDAESRAAASSAASDGRAELLLQIDDEADEDAMVALLEPEPPAGVELLSTECLIGEEAAEGEGGQLLMFCRRVQLQGGDAADERKDSRVMDVTPSHAAGAAQTAASAGEESRTARRLSLFRSSRGRESPATAASLPPAPAVSATSSSSSAAAAGGDERRGGASGLNRQLSAAYHAMYASLCSHLQLMRPCYLAGLRSLLYVVGDGTVEVVMTGVAMRRKEGRRAGGGGGEEDAPTDSVSDSSDSDDDGDKEAAGAAQEEATRIGSAAAAETAAVLDSPHSDARRRKDKRRKRERQRDRDRDRKAAADSAAAAAGEQPSSSPALPSPPPPLSSSRRRPPPPSLDSVTTLLPSLSHQYEKEWRQQQSGFASPPPSPSHQTLSLPPLPPLPPPVLLSPLSSIAGHRITGYLGCVHLHLIKEVWSASAAGGSEGWLGVFVHRLLCEVNAVMRSHVAGRGGDGCVGYRLDEMRVMDSTRTQVYAIVAVSGDAVKLQRC